MYAKSFSAKEVRTNGALMAEALTISTKRGFASKMNRE